jgi:aldehyde dehydrogenase (NAD+)
MNEHLPDGVLNVVTGCGSDIGEAMVHHEGIHKVSFTGSTGVGRGVAASAGKRLAHVSLELGGKSPNIVCPSAASPELIESTADGVLLAMRFTRQGQSCTAGSRLFLHEDIHDEFLKVLVRKVAALKVGDPMDEATDMGSIINAKQYASIANYVAEGKSMPGVRVALDGEGQVPEGLDGYYQAPTILAGGSNDWRVSREEIFGPVMVVIPWSTTDEVVRMANASNYGLAAYVWSHDLHEALGLAHAVESGWVQVNQGGGQVVGQSYGGFKNSGIGREYSIEGAIASFTQTKQINVKLNA